MTGPFITLTSYGDKQVLVNLAHVRVIEAARPDEHPVQSVLWFTYEDEPGDRQTVWVHESLASITAMIHDAPSGERPV
jgi:hypothetical protein